MLNCRLCDLCITRKNVVLGIGNQTADIMLIGEAPGYTEDKEGIPFVGESGVYLRKSLSNVNLDETNIYFTNSVKCRPPKNRNPYPYEIETCTSNILGQEIQYINPVFIITAGAIATTPWLGETSMGKLIGNYYEVANKYILPIYHPSYIIRDDKRKPMYVDLIEYVKKTIYHLAYVNAFEIATIDKNIKSPF